MNILAWETSLHKKKLFLIKVDSCCTNIRIPNQNLSRNGERVPEIWLSFNKTDKYMNFYFDIYCIISTNIEIINIHSFAFLNFWFWEKKRFADFLTKKNYKFSKNIVKIPYRRVAQKRYNFAPGAANPFFWLTLYNFKLGNPALFGKKSFFSRVKSLQLLNQAKHISVALPSSSDKIWSKGQSQEIPELWSDIQTNKPRLYFFTWIEDIGNKQW